MELLSIILIVIGMVLLVAEMFIPSFGVSGVAGIIAIIAGVVLSANSVGEGIVMFLVILAIVLILMLIAYRFVVSKKSPLILKDQLHEEETSDMGYFIGKEGIALTTLRPSGKGDFDGVRLDILTQGTFIKKDARIVISSITGKKIFVEEMK